MDAVVLGSAAAVLGVLEDIRSILKDVRKGPEHTHAQLRDGPAVATPSDAEAGDAEAGAGAADADGWVKLGPNRYGPRSEAGRS